MVSSGRGGGSSPASASVTPHFTTPSNLLWCAPLRPGPCLWERRDARITNWKDGSVAFEQLGVEFPVTWSLNATNIVAQKYFRGTLGTPERESSLRQVIDRVADTITTVGHRGRLLRRRPTRPRRSAELKFTSSPSARRSTARCGSTSA
jgi:hypothetical protein